MFLGSWPQRFTAHPLLPPAVHWEHRCWTHQESCPPTTAEEEEVLPHPAALHQGCHIQLAPCLLTGSMFSFSSQLWSCCPTQGKRASCEVWVRQHLSTTSILGFRDKLRPGWRDTFLEDGQMLLSTDVRPRIESKRDLLHVNQSGLWFCAEVLLSLVSSPSRTSFNCLSTSK